MAKYWVLAVTDKMCFFFFLFSHPLLAVFLSLFWGQTVAKEHKPLIIKQGDRTRLLSGSLSTLTPKSARMGIHKNVNTHSHHQLMCFRKKKKYNFLIVIIFFHPQIYKSASPITAFSLHLLLKYTWVHAGNPLYYISSAFSQMPVPYFFLRTFPGFQKIVPGFGKEEKLLLRRSFWGWA